MCVGGRTVDGVDNLLPILGLLEFCDPLGVSYILSFAGLELHLFVLAKV